MDAPNNTAPEEESQSTLVTGFNRLTFAVKRRYQKILDSVTPYPYPRWVFTLILMKLYILRVYFAEGWYIITYALGIYLLNLLVDFLSPVFDPELEGEGELPTSNDDEFRPFIRKLPEWPFWVSATQALILGLIATMFQFLDIPVFWPILLLYWIALFGASMKARVQHMIKHKEKRGAWISEGAREKFWCEFTLSHSSLNPPGSIFESTKTAAVEPNPTFPKFEKRSLAGQHVWQSLFQKLNKQF